MRNALSRKGNHFSDPTLMLSTGFVLEAGVCFVKWIRHLHHKNKVKLVSNVRMSSNVVHVDSVSKQKVSSTLFFLENN